MEINLLSDTITKPSKEMLAAMFEAEVGDDVFKSDPTVNKLEEKAAGMFGMERALFCPSGTMANQIAVKLHTNPGDMLISDKLAHVYNYEGGGVAYNSGVTCKLLDGDRGRFTAEQVQAAISKDDIHFPASKLVAIENTTNKGGGACWNFDEIIKIRKVCDDNNLSFHLDGARLFNALIAKNESPKQYGEQFDTISICLSKGLGAPVGSLLLGTKAHFLKAIRIRKVMGGGMRQAGYLAAAGIYALDNNIHRLMDDHKRASVIASELEKLPYVKSVIPVETNILIFYLKEGIDESFFINKMSENGIYLASMGDGKIRIVTHLDFTDEMLTELITRLKKIKFN